MINNNPDKDLIIMWSILTAILLGLYATGVTPLANDYLVIEMFRGFIGIFIGISLIGFMIQQFDFLTDNELIFMLILIFTLSYMFALSVGYLVAIYMCPTYRLITILLQCMKPAIGALIVYVIIITNDYINNPFKELLKTTNIENHANLIGTAFWIAATAFPATLSLYVNVLNTACSSVENIPIDKIKQKELDP